MKTLRTKVTVIVSIILVTTMGLLTSYSIINSNKHFVQPILEKKLDNMSTEISTTGAKYADRVEENAVYPGAAIVFDANEAQKQFGGTQFLVMILIVFGGILSTYYLVGRLLDPLKKLNQAASQIDEHQLNTQISVPTSQDEVAALTISFNSMLNRLNHSFELQKNFAQNAAHELKTPLAVIKSSLQVLNLDEMPTIEDYKENAKIVEQSTDELIEIVGQLLALTDKTNIEKQEVLLDEIVRECLKEQSLVAAEINVTITTQLEEIKVHANAFLIKTIISNIISNAIKYNKQGGSLFVGIDKTGDYVQITIRDTGIGIDKEDLACIFEPFFRADESRSKKINGNGLGLSIVKAAIQKLDGDIMINSEFGVGTESIIKLPLS